MDLFSELDMVSSMALCFFIEEAGYRFIALRKLLVVLLKHKNTWQGYSVPLSFNWVGNNSLNKHKTLLNPQILRNQNNPRTGTSNMLRVTKKLMHF